MNRHALKRTSPRKKVITWVLSVFVVVAFVVAGVFAGRAILKSLGIGVVNDYPGPGGEEVTFVIRDGETGTDIAERLVDEDVIKTYRAFLDAYNTRTPEPTFQPGAYKVQKQSPAADVLDILADPDNRVDIRVTIPEGYRVTQIVARIAEAADLEQGKVQAAVADVKSYDVPQKAKDLNSLEGFLFPATYTIAPEAEPKEIIEQMVAKTNQVLDDLGVEGDDLRYEVMTKASIVQRESANVVDMGKVARVIDNRLAQGMHLQMDSTVTYGTGRTDQVEPTTQELQDTSNRYNTYANAGLPIGPIANPGEDAIKAVLNPTPGDWLYFVTVNLDTGETVFSTTQAEHDQAVQQYNAWKAQQGGEQ